MKNIPLLAVLAVFSVFNLSFLRAAEPRSAPYVAREYNLRVPAKLTHAAPVNLGGGQRGFVFLFSEESNVDPFEGSFFFPKHPPFLAVFTEAGKELWRKELTYALPGTWFIPVLPLDMDGDGIDEIYYVNNTGPKPFVYKNYKLERLDSRTGKVTAAISWPQPTHNQANSYKWRFSLVGGRARDGAPVLVAGVGTYRDMRLRAFDANLKKRWEVYYPDDFDGPRASHSTAILDLDRNRHGAGQFMWGERCIDFDDGKERFVLDRDAWYDHSDTVLPVYDKATGKWDFWTTREKGDDGKVPRAVMFDQDGKRLWSVPDMRGHFHYGWVGNFGPAGERIAMAGRYALSEEQRDTARASGDTSKAATSVFSFYEAKTGKPLPAPKFPPSGRVVDFNGDGFHEIFTGGVLYDRFGKKIFSVKKAGALMCFHILDLPGEQIMLNTGNGKIQIWADRNAKDAPGMAARYADPLYRENVRHSAVGYNGRVPILNY
ncbi:polysaccharide lyase 11 [Ereboglobus luteus]|nr:polysaccharide lyase 11 [Ereboglobus luteus]